MSTPRALRPLLGVGSRLVAGQSVPGSAATTASKKLFHGSAAAAVLTPPSTASGRLSPSVCWRCRYDNSSRRQRSRASSSSSSSSSKPPNSNSSSSDRSDSEPPTHSSPFFSSSSSSPSPSPPSSAANAADAAEIGPREISTDPSESHRAQDGSAPQPQPQPPPSTPDPDLPSAQNSRRSALNQSLSSFMDRAQTTLFAASQRINDLTGYSSIESLKAQISTLEAELHNAQSHLTATRAAYKSAVSERAATQREVTTLLARQKTWTPLDFERFTTLYRQDYELEAAVGERAAELERAEREAERLGRELGAGILARYHEEQIWSDKIRRMSTWGTWGLMGVNILLFLLLQFGAEPWRRRRLVRGFEEKVREALAEERAARERAERVAFAAVAGYGAASTGTGTGTAPIPLSLEQESPVAVPGKGESISEDPVLIAATPDIAVPESDIIAAPSSIPTSLEDSTPRDSLLSKLSWREALADLNYWRAFFLDLASERRIALRMRDVSLIAIEGFVTGIALAGSLAFFLARRA